LIILKIFGIKNTALWSIKEFLRIIKYKKYKNGKYQVTFSLLIAAVFCNKQYLIRERWPRKKGWSL